MKLCLIFVIISFPLILRSIVSLGQAEKTPSKNKQVKSRNLSFRKKNLLVVIRDRKNLKKTRCLLAMLVVIRPPLEVTYGPKGWYLLDIRAAGDSYVAY